jgi:hypothetical protein
MAEESLKPTLRVVGVDLLLVVPLVVLAAAMGASLTPHGAATSPDSLRYLDAAGHIAAGDGAVISVHRLDAPEPVRPLTDWPPLYPIVLSPFVSGADSPAVGAARFSTLALSLSVALMYLVLRPAAGRVAGVIGSLVVLLNRSTLTVFSYAWSETLFVPLSLACCWIACRVSEPPGNANRWRRFLPPLLLSVCLAAVFYCRYIGLTYSVVFVTVWIASRDRERFGFGRVVPPVLYLALIGLELARNIRLTGEISGGRRPPPTMGVIENLRDLWGALVLQLQHNAVLSVAVFLVALVVVLLLSAFRTRVDDIIGEGSKRRSMVLLLHSTALCASYAVGLVAARSMREFDRIDVRLVTPCVLFLIVILTVASARLLTADARQRWAIPLAALSLSFLCLSTIDGVKVFRRALESLESTHSPALEVRRGITYNSFTFGPSHQESTRFIESIDPDPSAVFITEDPMAFNFVTGRKTFRFPSGPISDEDISRMNRYSDPRAYLFLTRRDSMGRLADYYGGDWDFLLPNRRFWDGTVLVLVLPLPAREYP